MGVRESFVLYVVVINQNLKARGVFRVGKFEEGKGKPVKVRLATLLTAEEVLKGVLKVGKT